MIYFIVAGATTVVFIYLIKLFAKFYAHDMSGGVFDSIGAWADDLNTEIGLFVVLALGAGAIWPITWLVIIAIVIIYTFEKVVGI